MHSCFYCASPIEEGGDVCRFCGGLVPAASGRSVPVPQEEPGEQGPEEAGWLPPPKVRELEKPSWRTRLVEMAALAAFATVVVAGGVLAFEMHVAKEGKIEALFTALGVAALLVVPAALFAGLAAVTVGAAAILVESALAPLLRRASLYQMPPLPHSVLAKTDALGGPPLPEAEDPRLTRATSAEKRPNVQRPDGEGPAPLS